MQPVGWIQRVALWPLIRGSRRVIVTVPDRLNRMREIFPQWADRFELLPIGRNIEPSNAEDFRASLGVPSGAVLLLFMGLVHPSKGFPLMERTLTELEARGLDVRVVVMGGGAINHALALNLGFVTAEEASRALVACDLALLPLTDGASTRRTSLMNALGAGLPVLSTIGPNTDEDFFADAVKLVPVADEEGFIDAAAELIADASKREALGARGQALYDRSLSWEILADRWYALLNDAVELGH
jgi:glycosyltransferase involved in cell wall biosynthesis